MFISDFEYIASYILSSPGHQNCLSQYTCIFLCTSNWLTVNDFFKYIMQLLCICVMFLHYFGVISSHALNSVISN